MSTKLELNNANGKSITIENSDTNFSQHSIDVSKITKSIDTIADFRAMISTPDTIYVTGYHTKDDGAFGSNFFKLRAGVVPDGSFDNGGTVIENVNGVYELQFEGDLNASYWGVISTNDDNSQQITEAIKSDIVKEHKTLVLPSGNITFKATVDFTNIVNNGFKLVGNDGCVVITKDDAMLFFSNFLTNEYEVLTADAYILDNFITATDASKYSIGDYISIRSDEVVEIGWGYKAQGTYIVTDIAGTKIILDRKLRFNFKASDNSRVYIVKNTSKTIINNIHFIQDGGSSGTCSIRFTQMNNVYMNNCSVERVNGSGEEDGVQFDRVSNIRITNFDSLKTRYPIFISVGYDSYIQNITGNGSRHLVDFNSWHEKAIVDGFAGYSVNGSVNSHPSFDITYKNGTANDRYVCSNFRWFGGGCENVEINIAESCIVSGMYSGVNMVEASYPKYTNLLKELNLMAYYNNVTINDDRTNVSYQGIGFNIGVSGTFDNIRNTRGVTYTEERSLDLTLGNFEPPVLNNRCINLLSTFNRLSEVPRDAIQDTSDLTLYRLTEDSTNVTVKMIKDGEWETKSFGNIVSNTVHTSASITLKFNDMNNRYGRVNSHYMRIKLIYRSWHGTAEKTIQVFNEPSSGTVTLIGECPTVTTDDTKADIAVINFVTDDETASTQNAPIQFDINFTMLDSNRPFSLDYECTSICRK